MSYLDKFKKNRESLMSKVQDKIRSDGNAGYEKDPRFWTLSRNKEEVGDAIIRFLPDVKGDETWVKVIKYAFKGPSGNWYIENSLRTIGEEDPVNDANKKLYATGSESDKELAKKRPAKTEYISNIYVVKDSANPSNEGKVFLYSYGKTIMEFIKNAMNPKFEDDVQINPFDVLEDGANFRLRIYRSEKNDQFTYESSKFQQQKPLFEDEDDIEQVLEQTYELGEFVAPDKFKSYKDLEKRFKLVWLNEEDEYGYSAEDDVEEKAEAEQVNQVPQKKETKKLSSPSVDEDEEEDSSMDFFKD